VKDVPKLYSKEFLVYNVHSLLHLSNDARIHGPLDEFSAFKYENNMQNIKKTLRAKYKPFEQVVNRICELDTLEYSNLPICRRFIKITIGNNSFILKCGSVVVLTEIISGGKYRCKKFCKLASFFSYPCNSIYVDIKLVCKLSDTEIVINTNEIAAKCWLLPYESKYVSIPLSNW